MNTRLYALYRFTRVHLSRESDPNLVSTCTLWLVFKEKNLGSLFAIEGGNMPEGRKLRQRKEREKEEGTYLEF